MSASAFPSQQLIADLFNQIVRLRHGLQQLTAAAGRSEDAPAMTRQLSIVGRELLDWSDLLETVLNDDTPLLPASGMDVVDFVNLQDLINLRHTMDQVAERVEGFLKLYAGGGLSAADPADRNGVLRRGSELLNLMDETTDAIAAFFWRLDETGRLTNSSARAQRLLLATRRAAREAQSAADQAKQSQHDAAVTVGKQATNTLATSFESYTDAQATSARWWMAFSVLAVTAVVVVGVLLLRASEPSWQQTVAHLVIALPAAGVAAYSARESSRHRESSQWARRVAAQLDSIGQYVAQLPESEQTALLVSFGTYIFGPQATAPAENQLHTVPPELVKALTDLVQASK